MKSGGVRSLWRGCSARRKRGDVVFQCPSVRFAKILLCRLTSARPPTLAKLVQQRGPQVIADERLTFMSLPQDSMCGRIERQRYNLWNAHA